jgi:hypothetical protein
MAKRPSMNVDGVTLYRCSKCEGFFDRSNFYADKRTPVGIKAECRKCHYKTKWRTRDVEKHREASKASARRARERDPDKVKAKVREASRLRRLKPKTEKDVARSKFHVALRSGRILKPELCEGCGERKRLTGHHEDYSKPLDVRWLCYACHGKEHRRS